MTVTSQGNISQCFMSNCKAEPLFQVFIWSDDNEVVERFCCQEHFSEVEKDWNSKYLFGYRKLDEKFIAWEPWTPTKESSGFVIGW